MNQTRDEKYGVESYNGILVDGVEHSTFSSWDLKTGKEQATKTQRGSRILALLFL